MTNIKFFVDSSSDVPEEYAIANNIGVFPMPVIFDGKVYLDWTELKSDEFFKMLAESKTLPTTSQLVIPDIERDFREALKTHDAIICITLSSKGSGTYHGCNIAKESILKDIPDAKIEIVDAMAYSLYTSSMLGEALRLYKQGKSVEDIVAGIKTHREHTTTVVVVDTLKYLEKGGRINKASLVIGTLLDIKPVLTVKKGVMETIDKFKGRKTVIPKMIQKIKEMDINLSDPNFHIVHGNVPDRAQELWTAIKAEFGEAQELKMMASLGATIGTHIGPGTLAVAFKTNKPFEKIYED